MGARRGDLIMRSLQNLGNNFQTPGSDLTETTKKRLVPDQAALVVNKLFLDLKGIFPAWKVAFPNQQIEQQSKIEWIKAFVENDIGQTAQLNFGLQKARNYSEPWFPSCGQFIKWCKPQLEDYGLPTAEQALRKVINGQKRSHPVLFLTAQATGSRELKTMSHDVLLKLFTRNYEIVCQRFINGEDLSQEIHKALPTNVYVVANQSQRSKNAANLRQLLKQKRAT